METAAASAAVRSWAAHNKREVDRAGQRQLESVAEQLEWTEGAAGKFEWELFPGGYRRGRRRRREGALRGRAVHPGRALRVGAPASRMSLSPGRRRDRDQVWCALRDRARDGRPERARARVRIRTADA